MTKTRKKMDQELYELRAKIKKEREFVGRLPYSHNLISMWLQAIHKKFGQGALNAAIKELKLEALGWVCLP